LVQPRFAKARLPVRLLVLVRFGESLLLMYGKSQEIRDAIPRQPPAEQPTSASRDVGSRRFAAVDSHTGSRARKPNVTLLGGDDYKPGASSRIRSVERSRTGSRLIAHSYAGAAAQSLSSP